MKSRCEDIRELLVDYADGVLAADAAREVAEHLEQCRACQLKVKALTRSLAAAQAIWQASEEPEKGVRPREEKGSDPFFRYAAAAAAIVVVGVAAAMFSMRSGPAPTLEQMEASIGQAADAARILAAADIVGAQQGGEAAAKEQYLLITTSYKKTPSAKEGLSRMKSYERRS
jgi:anti-sigma factor RsiW